MTDLEQPIPRPTGNSLIREASKYIRANEGYKLFVYDDSSGLPIVSGSSVRGHPSIGVGRNLSAKGISQVEAEMMFLNDLADAEEYARAYVGDVVWMELNDWRKISLLDLAHNLGPRGLFAFKRLREAISCSAWEAAAEELLDSKYARQLPARAKRNAELLLTGKAPG
jgi:lysozyme